MYRRTGTQMLGAAVLLVHAVVSGAEAQQTSLTVYPDGRVVVRRTLPVAVSRGTATVSADLGARTVDPGSLVALDDGVEIRAARVVAATGREGSLRRSLGRELEFRIGPADSLRLVRATLLSLEPPAVRLDGRILYSFPGEPAFPDSVVQLAPRVDLTVEAARAQPALRVAFLTSGLSWRASYALVVPRARGGRGAMSGMATIENPGGLSLRGAEVQLLAGDVRPAREIVRRAPAMVQPMVMAAAPAPAPAEESVGETHVYTVPGVVDFAPGETRTVALFARADVDPQPEYLLRSSRFGYLERWPGPEQDLHAQVSYLVRRPLDTPFGMTPLPAGIARVLAPDSVGRLQLVGEVPIQHTPAGRELHLATGTAFDLTAQRTQLTFERVAREVVTSYRVTIQSAKSDSVSVNVLDEFPGQWELLSSTVRAERLSASSVRFAVPVRAGAEAVLEYRVRIRW